MGSPDGKNFESWTPEFYLQTAARGSSIYYIQPARPFRHPGFPGRGYIRVFYLHPLGNNPYSVKGCLKVRKLDAQCKYEAVSYSWGDFPARTQPLLLNGQVFMITENLYTALLHYDYPDRPRALWVDAICINQADPVEKAQQVAMMSKIYSNAETVQCWLGPGWPWAEDAVEFISNLSRKAESFGIADQAGRPRWCETVPSLEISHDEAQNLIHDAIEAHVDLLLFRSWFNRVWVVQEVTLAAELVVSCGNFSMKWSSFAHALEIIQTALKQVPMGEERLRLAGTERAWELVWHRSNFRLLDQNYGKNHVMNSVVNPMMGSRDCSDDRDRVYAMLAMTSSPHAMTPDYDKTVAEAYTEFTTKYSPNRQIYAAGLSRRRHQLSKKEDISAVNDGHSPIDISDRDYLPSWVPEFRPSMRNNVCAIPVNSEYRTARAAPSFFLPDPETANVMYVGGAAFDSIWVASLDYNPKKSTACPLLEPGFFFTTVDRLQEILLLSSDSDPGLKPRSEPVWFILAKVLTAGFGTFKASEKILSRSRHFESLSHLHSGSLPWLTAIWDKFAAHSLSPTGEVYQHILLEALGGGPKALSEDGMVAFEFLYYLADALSAYRLFMTMRGYLGLAPRITESGDFIVVFNGCNMPYAVRAAGNVKCKERARGKTGNRQEMVAVYGDTGTLQVIGPCYLHGIMKGEIFTDPNAAQFSHLKWIRYDGDTVDSLAGGFALI